MLCCYALCVAMACLSYACECDYHVNDIYVVTLSFPYEILGTVCIGSAG